MHVIAWFFRVCYKADVMKPSPLHTQCMDMLCWYIRLVMKEHMRCFIVSYRDMYFHRFTHCTILGITTMNSMHSVGAALTDSLHNLATELLLHPWTSRSNLTATTVGGVIRRDIKVDSVETVIRFRQSPPEGDITSVTISIV